MAVLGHMFFLNGGHFPDEQLFAERALVLLLGNWRAVELLPCLGEATRSRQQRGQRDHRREPEHGFGCRHPPDGFSPPGTSFALRARKTEISRALSTCVACHAAPDIQENGRATAGCRSCWVGTPSDWSRGGCRPGTTEFPGARRRRKLHRRPPAVFLRPQPGPDAQSRSSTRPTAAHPWTDRHHAQSRRRPKPLRHNATRSADPVARPDADHVRMP
jgi:hypothetical protein